MKLKWPTKKERPLPEDTVCRNCNTQTVGRYCHHCGQDLFAGVGQPFFTLISSFLAKALALNGKTPVTLAYLMFRPGFLATEYRLGRIKKYVHPVSLFWISTLIFFALLISRADFGNNQTEVDVTSARQAIMDNISDPIAQQQVMQALDFSSNASRPRFYVSGTEIDNELIRNLSRYAPYTAFLFAPIFALLLMLFFWRSRFLYVYHMVFSMHFHTFLWIYCTLFLVLFWLFPNLSFPGWLTFLFLIMPGVYLSVAFRRFYLYQTRWKAIWKSMLIGFVYFMMILLGTVGLIMLVLRIIGII
ncbi:MAG: DUF3667 domain-containing protein [Bacteroidales bacterium]|nr:DUF3667 domain-containing protein [Bacteroidales bacterium]